MYQKMQFEVSYRPKLMSTTAAIPFSDVRVGMRARVASYTKDQPELRRLAEMGLTEGTEFEVVKVAPLGDPIEIALRGYRLCLRRKEADGLLIVVVS